MLSLWTGGLAIVSMSVSISAAQGLYALAVLALVYDRFQAPGPVWPSSLRKVYSALLLIYGSWVLSSLVHALIETSADPLKALLHSDIKDVLLSGMGLWAYHHAAHSEERRRLLYRFLAVGFLVVLLSGLAAVFSPFRLSRILYHMQHGWEFSAEARLQHPLFHLHFRGMTIPLHMPVGFLGTHLAYGAQLGFFFVPLALFCLDRIVNRFRGFRFFDALMVGLTLLAAFVLLMNNARSALFGIISALLAGVLVLTGSSWKKRVWILALPPLVVTLLAAGGLALTGGKGYLRDFLMQSVGLEQKHSDYQRVMLWSSAAGLVEEHPLIGTGPGRFSDAVLDAMNARSAERPWLWYLNMQTERGHSHNDFLHQLASAGIPAAAAYTLFWFLILRFLLSRSSGPVIVDSSGGSASGTGILDLDSRLREFLPYAPILLLFGGVFQCYFLDDQVMLPFWLMLGLAFQAREGQPIRG